MKMKLRRRSLLRCVAHGVATLVDGPTLAGGDDVVGARGEGGGARGGAVGVRGVGARLGGGAGGDLF